MDAEAASLIPNDLLSSPRETNSHASRPPHTSTLSPTLQVNNAWAPLPSRYKLTARPNLNDPPLYARASSPVPCISRGSSLGSIRSFHFHARRGKESSRWKLNARLFARFTINAERLINQLRYADRFGSPEKSPLTRAPGRV